jgi:N-methylhydantoinase A
MWRADQADDAGLQQARARLVASLVAPHEALVDHAWIRARYAGQGHELDVACVADDAITSIVERFQTQHDERFGYRLDRPVEFVSLRVACEGAWWPLRLERSTPAQPFDGVDHGAALPDVHVIGPSTIRLPDATLRVAAGWSARPHEGGGWWLERREITP